MGGVIRDDAPMLRPPGYTGVARDGRRRYMRLRAGVVLHMLLGGTYNSLVNVENAAGCWSSPSGWGRFSDVPFARRELVESSTGGRS